MKILILCSGGDAPGMNRFIYNLSKLDEVYYARAGFKGLVEGDILPLNKNEAKKLKMRQEQSSSLHAIQNFKSESIF